MHSNLADETGRVTRRLVDFLALRAAGGCGMIIVESASVEGNCGGTRGCLRIDGVDHEAGLADLVATIKSSGARIVAQLWHAGPRAQHAAERPVTASVRPDDGSPARELEEAEVPTIVGRFVEAAARACSVGFDAVEIHAAHGYLLHQFLSAKSNFREDRYGGSLVGRFAVLLEIREGILATCPELPVILRASVERDDDIAELGSLIESAGYHAVDVREGFTSYPPVGIDGRPVRCHAFDLAAQIRSRSQIPVMLGGGILDAKDADLALNCADADAIVVGRALVADPDWANRILANLLVTPCKYDCDPSCYSEVRSGRRIRCVHHEEPRRAPE